MRSVNDRKIILPDQDGVSNLEIRRMQNELEDDSGPVEMLGCLPVNLIKKVVGELNETIESVERGAV